MGIAGAFIAIGIVVGQFRGERKSKARIELLQGRCSKLKTRLDDVKLRLSAYENIEEAEALSDAAMAEEIFVNRW